MKGGTVSAMSPRAQLALVVGGLLAVAVGGYLLLISPKRSEAAELDVRIAQVEQQIADAQAKSLARQAKVALKTADLFRLAKAMPDDANMSSVILELNRVAADAGIVFETITPQGVVQDAGYQALPITLMFTGNFYTLSDFLFRLRHLVQVRGGRLNAKGRLFGIDSLSFTQGDKGFPQIKADLTVNAFIFGGSAPAAGALPTEGETTTTPTETTTTGETTTTPEPQPSGSAPTATPAAKDTTD